MTQSKALTSLFVLIVLGFYFQAHPTFAATELARVGSRIITLEEFNKKYQDNQKYFQFKSPSKKAVLEDIITRELGIQEARREGLDRDADVLDRMNTVLYQSFLDKKLGKEVESLKLSDEDARRFYEKNPEIRTSHILIALAPNASLEDVKRAKDRAQSVLDEDLKSGKMSFAEVAQKYSEAPSAPMGGDVDYQTRDKLDPIYYEAALRLGSPGRVSGLVRTSIGFNIIKLTAIRSWEDADKAQAKRILFEDRKHQIFEKLMTQLRTQLGVKENTALLKE